MMKLSICGFLLIAFSALSILPTYAELDVSSHLAKNKETARLWYEDVVRNKDPKIIETICAPDVVQELAPSFVSPLTGTNKVVGVENVKQHMARTHELGTYMPRNAVVVAEGNRVAVLREVTEKLKDGRTAVISWVTFFEFNDEGKIVHLTHVHDSLAEKTQFDKSAAKPQ